MSLKKRSTTGLPGSTKRDAALRKQFKPRAHRENEVNRLVLIITGAIFGLIIVILGAAFLIDGVVNPNRSVASVGNQSIALHDYQQRVIFERWQRGIQIQQVYQNQYLSQQLADSTTAYGAMYAQLNDPPTFGKTVLTEMTDGMLAEQYAAQHGITLTDADLQAEVNKGFGYNPNAPTATVTGTPSLTPSPIVSDTPTSSPTPTVAPTITPTLVPTDLPTGIPTNTPGPVQQKTLLATNQNDFFTAAAKGTGLSVDTVTKLYSDMIRETTIQKKVQESLFGKPNPLQDEVKVRHILLKTQAQAQSVVAALKSGASFASLAAADSTDTGSGATGGELGWTAHSGKYVKEFESYVWGDPTKTVGVVSDPPIKSQFGYHVIQVEARQQRTLTAQEQQSVLTYQYTNWLTDATANTIKVTTNDALYTANTPSTPDLQTAFSVPNNLTQGARGASGLPAGLGQ